MRAGFVAVVVVLACSLARGAVITVPSPGISTIQQGVNASFSGDTVRVKAGIYEETVTIAANKDGLTLIGLGNVILDARPFFIANGPGLEVLADDVTVRNLTIRCARTGGGGEGHGLLVDAGGFVGTKITVKHCQASGIHVLGSNAKLTSCRVESVGGDGIHVEFGFGLVAKNCIVRAASGSGIAVVGNDVRIENCRVRGAADTAIDATGVNALVRKCVVETSFDAGIVVTGSGALVEDSRSVRSGETGISVVGGSSVVRRCKVSGSEQLGIHAIGNDVLVEDNVVSDCVAGLELGSTGGAVRGNRVLRQFLFGIELDTCVQVTIEDNVFAGCGAEGITAHDGSFETIRDNVVKDAGQIGEWPLTMSVYLTSDTAIVTNNRIVGGSGDGIQVAADGCALVDNMIVGCGEDGIDVASGAGTVLQRNEVRNCVAEGIENNGTNTSWIDNVAKKNRTDLANDGTLNVVSGNVFVTGGTNEVPLVD